MQHPAQRERDIAAVAGGEVEIGKRGKVSSQALTRSLSPPRQPTSTSIQLITLMARVFLLLQPSQGDGFAAQHVDQDVGVEQQHQGASHSRRSAWRSASARDSPRWRQWASSWARSASGRSTIVRISIAQLDNGIVEGASFAAA